uniref:Cytosolic arginine sensor for mTORC1 subunit 1 n=2 Tax=Psittaciformes TaxID=9223 RepID=A0A8V5H674_MELUD
MAPEPGALRLRVCPPSLAVPPRCGDPPQERCAPAIPVEGEVAPPGGDARSGALPPRLRVLLESDLAAGAGTGPTSPRVPPAAPARSPGPEPRLFWRFLRRNRRWEHPPRAWIRPRSRPAQPWSGNRVRSLPHDGDPPRGDLPITTELPPSEFMQVADSTWLVLSVVSNGREPPGCQATGVTKIARSVIAPLAEHHVSVLMLSTYQTDFILVRERDLPVVIHTLAGEFDIYKEESGECVPVTCEDVSNGFLKPKPAASPTLHPVQSPQTRFCILTVAPDTLPAIATMLIDVLFYSHSPPWEPGAGSQDLDSITFFAFSLIDGYISIVMDAETQKRFPSDLLLTSSTGELWRMVRIGGQPLGFDECGIVAQIAEPLAAADISAYYISTFNFDHALVPEEGIAEVIQLLQQRQDSSR